MLFLSEGVIGVNSGYAEAQRKMCYKYENIDYSSIPYCIKIPIITCFLLKAKYMFL